jgi:acyl carrier protein
MDDLENIEGRLLDYLMTEIFDSSVTIDAQTDLLAAGMDSMALLRLLHFIEASLHIRLPEAELTEERIKTVRNIAELIGWLRHPQ